MLDENGARNPLDLEMAHQAAEAALRDAERDLRLALEPGKKPAGATCSRDRERPLPDGLVAPLFNAACQRGQCLGELAESMRDGDLNEPAARPQPWWPASKKGKWNDWRQARLQLRTAVFRFGTFTGTPRIADVARQPEYLIEYLAPRHQRLTSAITSRASAPTSGPRWCCRVITGRPNEAAGVRP